MRVCCKYFGWAVAAGAAYFLYDRYRPRTVTEKIQDAVGAVAGTAVSGVNKAVDTVASAVK